MSGVRSDDARVAQLVEHATENRSVGGSTPSPGTTLLKMIRKPGTAALFPHCYFPTMRKIAWYEDMRLAGMLTRYRND